MTPEIVPSLGEMAAGLPRWLSHHGCVKPDFTHMDPCRKGKAPQEGIPDANLSQCTTERVEEQLS
jgi:hypothetical protein